MYVLFDVATIKVRGSSPPPTDFFFDNFKRFESHVIFLKLSLKPIFTLSLLANDLYIIQKETYKSMYVRADVTPF